MKKLTIILLLTTIISCSKKDEYPKLVVNIKATNCIYEEENNTFTFVYVSNVSFDEKYKRQIVQGWCNTRNVKEYSDEYLWMDTAWITKVGIAYME